MKRLKEMGMTAVAMTDHGNLYGALDFYISAQTAGIKPIIGCETYMAPGDRREKKKGAAHLILWAMNEEGYRNLMALVSKAHLEGFYYHPRIDRDLLKRHSAGLIGSSSCLGGEIPTVFRREGYEKAKEVALEYRSLFEPGHFYLEIMQNGYPEQKPLNEAFRQMGRETGLPLVATNDVHYLDADDSEAHEILMCISQGVTRDDPKHQKKYTDQLYLKSGAEMRNALPGFEDAIENTLRISEACRLELILGKPALPRFESPEGCTLEEFLKRKAREMLPARLEELAAVRGSVDAEVYRERLENELEMICRMGFAGYFLIVHDIVDHAKGKGIPVGPGRGSGAGSLTAYVLRITDIDPIPFGLLFERFLNPERVSMPDFDIDFCKNRRDEVIAYISEKYGKDNVGQIATFQKLKSRSVIRDVGRVMGMPYSDVDKIAKMIPETPGMEVSISTVVENETQLREAAEKDSRLAKLLEFAKKLEGLNRHAGTHAAGVVISTGPLSETVPVFRGQAGELVTQYDKDMVEQAGLVKFDFLGLKTLTVLDIALRLINRRSDRAESPLKIEKIPMHAPEVFEMLSASNTTGIFQMESRGFRDLLRRLKPDCFEDIIAAVALYRPGPLKGGMVDKFIDCKHGRSPISYPHPAVAEVLKETYGVMVYQEQVMQAARILAGFSLGAADIMRRAMGKKKAEEMAQQRQAFVSGCVERGLSILQANEIFDLIDKFAGYGFNKSHSAAYALVAYRTAWLKANYPVEFLTALLTCDADNTDKVVAFLLEGRRQGIEVLPPDINESDLDFSVVYSSSKGIAPKIRFGLGAVKGVGKASLDAIFSARQKGGPFEDLFEFTARVDLKHVNRSTLEALVKSGAFDTVSQKKGLDRGRLFASIDLALERGRSHQRDRETGQRSLFGFLGQEEPRGESEVAVDRAEYLEPEEPWDERTILEAEKEALGMYMSGHPMKRYREEAARYADTTTAGCAERPHGARIKVAGVLEGWKERLTRGGSRIATFFLDDMEGRIEAVVYSKVLEDYRDILISGRPLLLSGYLRIEEVGEGEAPRLIIEEAMILAEVRSSRTTEIGLRVKAKKAGPDQIEDLKRVLLSHPGRCQVTLAVDIEGKSVVHIALPDEFRTNPTDDLIEEVKQILGENAVELR